MRIFRWLLALVALAVLGLDLYMSSKGIHLCPYEGCRVVSSTPFATLLGYPLVLWGIVFFAVAFLLAPSNALFALWSSIGMGFSLYMIYLQVFVVGKLCQLCLFVEAVVFVMFLSSLRWKRGLLPLIVIVGFLSTHALYTFPPAYADGSLEKAATWKGTGKYRIMFFFDPLCPACERSFKLLQGQKEKLAEVQFKSTAIHTGSMRRAAVFYGLCMSGKDPWEAFRLVHGERPPQLSRTPTYAKVKGIVEQNLSAIKALGIDAVPVIVVLDGESRRILVGYRELEEWLRSVSSNAPSPPLFLPLEQGICTPKHCD